MTPAAIMAHHRAVVAERAAELVMGYAGAPPGPGRDRAVLLSCTSLLAHAIADGLNAAAAQVTCSEIHAAALVRLRVLDVAGAGSGGRA